MPHLKPYILFKTNGKANLSIVSANLSSNGAVTYFNLTIKNNGNATVLVYAVSLNGTWDMVMSFVQPPAFGQHAGHGRHAPIMPFHVITPRVTSKPFEHKVRMDVVFFVENTTLVPSFEQRYFMPFMNGILLPPGKEITLSFKGVLFPIPFGAYQKHIFIVPIAGSSYTITLHSVPHSDARYNVTAK
jgi:hypothetical protein